RSAYKTSPKLQSWPICRPPLCPSCPTTWPTAWARLRPASAGSPAAAARQLGADPRQGRHQGDLLYCKLAPSPWRPSCRTSWHLPATDCRSSPSSAFSRMRAGSRCRRRCCRWGVAQPAWPT
uniref:Secreted protein n=1 Tax=Macrostomum lignano TaxID=282301 RepID=A0A1I8F5E0_9PLAT